MSWLKRRKSQLSAKWIIFNVNNKGKPMAVTKQDVVKYIAGTQPLIEKLASEKETFHDSLEMKLSTLVKAGSLSREEAQIIKKAVLQNPASVFNFLDVPTYNHTVGSIKQASVNSCQKSDPLYDFCYDN